MDQLTAIRSFAKPGYTPAKHTRIYNDRYYLCTFQNVERDPRSDYIGLGEGEYTELLDGANARAARDAHLNHLNRCKEYTGRIVQLTYTTLEGWNLSPYVRTIFTTPVQVPDIVNAERAKFPTYIVGARAYIARTRANPELRESHKHMDAYAQRIDEDERKGYPEPVIITVRH